MTDLRTLDNLEEDGIRSNMTNITTDNVFEDIGFDKQEAAN